MSISAHATSFLYNNDIIPVSLCNFRREQINASRERLLRELQTKFCVPKPRVPSIFQTGKGTRYTVQLPVNKIGYIEKVKHFILPVTQNAHMNERKFDKRKERYRLLKSSVMFCNDVKPFERERETFLH